MEKVKNLRTLVSLSELLIDRNQGYLKCIDDADTADVDLIRFFKEMADQSMRFKVELDAFLIKYSEEPAEFENSWLAKMHQTWIDIKTSLVKRDRKALIESCNFGDDVIIGAYEQSLENTEFFDAKIQETLRSHLVEFKKANALLEKLEKLEEAK